MATLAVVRQAAANRDLAAFKALLHEALEDADVQVAVAQVAAEAEFRRGRRNPRPLTLASARDINAARSYVRGREHRG